MKSVALLRVFLPAATLALLSSTGLASDKQTEAASLIEHAKQLSDIRADGAPAFRLKMAFKALMKDGSVLEGTYTEVWASKTQYRRETVAGDIRRTEIAEGQKRFLLEPVKALPDHIRDLPALSETDRFKPEVWRPEKIENRKLNGASVRCIETTPVTRGIRTSTRWDPEDWAETPSLCFDRGSGLLTGEIEPATYSSEGVTCFFFDYEKFGDRLYARAFKCIEGGKARLEARVFDLVLLPQADRELFALPNGARELTSCPDPVMAPSVVYSPYPAGLPHSGVVVISTIISFDGTTRDLRIVSSPSPKFEKAALEAVRQWRFRPATCDREPVEVRINVDFAAQVQ